MNFPQEVIDKFELKKSIGLIFGHFERCIDDFVSNDGSIWYAGANELITVLATERFDNKKYIKDTRFSIDCLLTASKELITSFYSISENEINKLKYENPTHRTN